MKKRRELAVQRVKDGYRVVDVVTFLGVDRTNVNKWVSAERKRGAEGLKAKPAEQAG